MPAGERFLDERHIDYGEINIDEYPEAVETVLKATGGKRQVPTLDIDGRFVTASPFSRQRLVEALGLR
ncbi:MAG TPA: glutaredoxin domain-containing protein [Vicinamibacteria bacterium]